MLPWAILVNWRLINGILRFSVSETSLTLSGKNSAGTEREECYIPTGNYWEGITVYRYFCCELVCTSLSQTVPQTMCFFTCPCMLCWFVFFLHSHSHPRGWYGSTGAEQPELCQTDGTAFGPSVHDVPPAGKAVQTCHYCGQLHRAGAPWTCVKMTAFLACVLLQFL